MDPITRQDIISGFQKIGIRSDMELEVHSSLKSLVYHPGNGF